MTWRSDDGANSSYYNSATGTMERLSQTTASTHSADTSIVDRGRLTTATTRGLFEPDSRIRRTSFILEEGKDDTDGTRGIETDTVTNATSGTTTEPLHHSLPSGVLPTFTTTSDAVSYMSCDDAATASVGGGGVCSSSSAFFDSAGTVVTQQQQQLQRPSTLMGRNGSNSFTGDGDASGDASGSPILSLRRILDGNLEDDDENNSNNYNQNHDDGREGTSLHMRQKQQQVFPKKPQITSLLEGIKTSLEKIEEQYGQERTEMEHQVSLLCPMIVKKDNRISKLEGQFHTEHDRREVAEEQLDSIRREYNILKLKCEQAEAKVHEMAEKLPKERDQQKQEIDACQNELQALREQHKVLEEQQQKLQTDHKKEVENKEELQEKLRVMGLLVDARDGELRRLQERIHRQQEDLANARKELLSQQKDQKTQQQQHSDKSSVQQAHQGQSNNSLATESWLRQIHQQNELFLELTETPIHPKYLSQIQQVGFVDLGIRYWPALILHPATLPPSEYSLQKQWLEQYRRKQQIQSNSNIDGDDGSSNFDYAVFLYGKKDTSSSFQIISSTKFIPYDEGAKEKQLHKLPHRLERKLKKGEKLKPQEEELYDGIQQINKQHEKEKDLLLQRRKQQEEQEQIQER